MIMYYMFGIFSAVMIIICVKPLCMEIISLIICMWYMDILYMMEFVLKIKNPVEGEKKKKKRLNQFIFFLIISKISQ